MAVCKLEETENRDKVGQFKRLTSRETNVLQDLKVKFNLIRIYGEKLPMKCLLEH